MYVPREFSASDPELLRAFVRANPFATLVTARGGEPRVSHVPFVVSGDGSPLPGALGVLRGHVARANPHVEHLGSGDALAIFVGPHGYVSPSLYTNRESVPTWNYGAVHVSGPVRLLDDAELDALLADLVAEHEGARARRGLEPWAYELPPEVDAAKKRAIRGFEIRPSRVEGKMKLSQNRSAEDQRRVIEDLERGDATSRELAALMRRVLSV
jgi:transcriptional regulator